MDVPAKFVKLMMLTSSENDSEALVALRKANAMLAEANVNWEEFLTLVGSHNKAMTRSSTTKDDSFSDVGRDKYGRYTDADDINALFEQAFAKTRQGSSFRDFLDSVHAWWESNGFLTEKQYSAIRRSALK